LNLHRLKAFIEVELCKQCVLFDPFHIHDDELCAVFSVREVDLKLFESMLGSDECQRAIRSVEKVGDDLVLRVIVEVV